MLQITIPYEKVESQGSGVYILRHFESSYRNLSSLFSGYFERLFAKLGAFLIISTIVCCCIGFLIYLFEKNRTFYFAMTHDAFFFRKAANSYLNFSLAQSTLRSRRHGLKLRQARQALHERLGIRVVLNIGVTHK